MRSLIKGCAAAWLAIAAAPAWADPDTHQLTITAKDMQGDCGSNGCIPVCTFVAQLKKVSNSTATEVDVRFYFKGHPGLEEGEETSFGFEFLSLGSVQSEEARDYVMGMPCTTIKVRRIEADSDSSSYLKIQFPGLKAPRIPAQKIMDGTPLVLPERG